MKLKGRDFLTLMDYTKEEINFILDSSAGFKLVTRERAKD